MNRPQTMTLPAALLDKRPELAGVGIGAVIVAGAVSDA